MRFCMVTTFYPPYHFGGDAIFIQQLSNELAKRGHHVEVIHCKDTFDFMTDRRPTAVCEDHPNVRVHTLESSVGMLSPLATHQTGRPFFKSSRLKEILEQPFDVIHYHNISLVGGPDVLRYGRAAKFYTLHEYWLVCPTHMLFKFNREACTDRQCFSCTLLHGRPPQFWRYTDLLEESVKHVDLFLAPSAFTRNKHLELGLNVPTVELPYFSSRWENQEAESSQSGDDPPYFLFVGRLEKLKGVQTLIPLFRRYDKAQLWIVGTGEYEAVLRRMAQDSCNIKFLGHQSGDRLRTLYEQAVATIVPSIWYEVFGIIILESFARATPAIVRNIGGMPKIIEESGGGMIFNTDEELLHAMDRLIEDPGLRHKLGRQGNVALHQRWTAGVHIPRYIGHVERVLESRKQKAVGSTMRNGSTLESHRAAMGTAEGVGLEMISRDQTDTSRSKPSVRIGLVGCGRLAEFGYLPAFRRASGVALVGVADVNPLRCKQIAPEVPAYKTIQDLIRAGGMDAIIVSTPTRCHLADATAAAQAKLPTLLEKPPGIDLSEAEALLDLVPRPWIAFNRHFDPDLARLRSNVPREGMLKVRLELHYRRKAWNPFDMQDDALLDLGPHLIDLARWLTASEATSVRTRTLNQEYVEFELELERGQATVICSCNSPYRERVRVWASDGRAFGTFRRGGIVAGIIGKLFPKRENPLVNSLVSQLEAFSCAVQGVPSAQPLSSVVDGVKVMSIIEAVRSSDHSGGSRRSVLELYQAD